MNADLEPLNVSGTAFLFVSLSVLKMSFMIEVVVYLTVIIILPHEHDTDAQDRACITEALSDKLDVSLVDA